MTAHSNDEFYTFTNGWKMEREPEKPHFWILSDENGNRIDRDRYRNDVIPRHNLTVATHYDPILGWITD